MSTDDLRRAVTSAILTGDGATATSDRRAAYDGGGSPTVAGYLAKVRTAATTITDSEVAALRTGGQSDAQLFELTVAAVVGHADRQYAAAEAALTAALAARGGA